MRGENKMNRPAVILVMCGSSVATSSLAAVKIEEEAKRRKVRVSVKKGKVSDTDTLIGMFNPDIIVATAQIAAREDVKVFSGVPLLTGIGQDKLYNDIFKAIEELVD
jgi:PTS system galactitol-specific IIB component